MKVYEGVCAMYIQSVHIQTFFIMYIRMKVSILIYMYISSEAPRELPRSLLCTWDNVNTHESVYAMYIHSVHIQSVYIMYVSMKVWIQRYIYITSVVLCELSSILLYTCHKPAMWLCSYIHVWTRPKNGHICTHTHTHTRTSTNTHKGIYIPHTFIYISQTDINVPPR